MTPTVNALLSHQSIVRLSRKLVAAGDFVAALKLPNDQSEVQRDTQHGYDYVVHAEINRILLVQGICRLELRVTPDDEKELSSEVYRDLMAVQHALSSIFSEFRFVHAVGVAASTLQKYEAAMKSDSPHQCIVQYWTELYGEGLVQPAAACSNALRAQLVWSLMDQGCHHEAIALIEFQLEEPASLLRSAALALHDTVKVAASLYAVRAAKMYAECGQLEIARDVLLSTNTLTTSRPTETVQHSANTDQVSADHEQDVPSNDSYESAKSYKNALQQRHFAKGDTTATRVRTLMNISTAFRSQQDFAAAFDVLELGADLLSQTADSIEIEALGRELHVTLISLCEDNGDRLSELLIKFRLCDFLGSTARNLPEAVEMRAELLASSGCDKLPFLQKHHQRQWAECLTTHQLGPAKHHAEMYLRYCQRCKDPRTQALAENIRLQTLLQPERMSSERRLNVLEDVRKELNLGIQHGRRNAWHEIVVERMLLLVEVLEEIDRLEGVDAEESVVTLVDILDDAAQLAAQVKWTNGDKFMTSELVLLRCSARQLLDEDDVTPIADVPDDDHVEILNHRQTGTLAQKVDRIWYFQRLMFAMQHGLLQRFETIYNDLCRHIEIAVEANDTFIQAELLFTKGLVLYFLMQEPRENVEKLWAVAEFDTYLSGSQKVLECFSFAAGLKSHADLGMGRQSMGDHVQTLSITQAYLNNAVKQVCMDIALELSVSIGDLSDIWVWIQRCKAQGLLKSLGTLFPTHADGKPLMTPVGEAVSFEDLRYIQSASAYQLVFVDWICYGSHPAKILFYSCRIVADDCHKTLVPLEVDVDDLRDAQERVNDATMRDSEAETRYLRPFEPLIAPLVECSEPGDILILSASSPFHNIPLHAVTIGENPLIERNPIVYAASHGVLLNILQRLEAPQPGIKAPGSWQPVVFGCYEDDNEQSVTRTERENIYLSLGELSHALGTEPILGDTVTTDNLKRQARAADLLHFHGHAQHDPHDPSSQCLILGPSGAKLAMNDIASLDLHAAHVNLIACSGGLQDFSLFGNEPFGLPTAFMLGGATSLIAASWPIQSAAGRSFTEIFYKYFLTHVDRKEFGPVVNLAHTLQHTVLEMRKLDGMSAPYYWAPFVLHGNWFCRRKPGSW